MRPTLFVGSSTESLDVAYAAQRNLEDVAEVVVWTQGIFELSKSSLESMLDAMDDTEFGLFIFGADDVTKIRGIEARTVRDNVVFELGLFMGRLGRERTFMIMPKDVVDFHLPSDLMGISAATFIQPSKPERMQAALGPACHDIRTAILGLLKATNEARLAGEKEERSLLPMLIPESERKHLLNLAHGRTREYEGRGTLRKELRHLRSLNLIMMQAGRHIGDVSSGSRFDLVDFVKLTDLGRQFVGSFAAR